MTKETRRLRAEKERKRQEGLPHFRFGERNEAKRDKRVPTNLYEIRQALSKQFKQFFREPLNRAERRKEAKAWQSKGRGHTKPLAKGDSEKRKVKQLKQGKKWRNRNNRKENT